MAVAAAMLIGLLAPAARARAPGGFFGVVPQEPLSRLDLRRVAGLGLRLRLSVDWAAVEPAPGRFDFTELDRTMGETSRLGIGVLLEIGTSPAWVAPDPARPPLRSEALDAWKRFLRRLVRRYGSQGSFWGDALTEPGVCGWQIWNEPDYPVFWSPRPSPRRYARFLKVSAQVIRGVDPHAVVVAAGLAPIEHEMRPWEFLRRMYEVRGTARAFDAAALHPYASTVAGVEDEVRRTRRVMARAGDGRKPLLLTELGVASDAEIPNPFDRGPLGQARFLRRAFDRMLGERQRWRIGGVYWFSWKDAPAPDPACIFCQYAGLFDVNGNPKPAWWALRRVIARARG